MGLDILLERRKVLRDLLEINKDEIEELYDYDDLIGCYLVTAKSENICFTEECRTEKEADEISAYFFGKGFSSFEINVKEIKKEETITDIIRKNRGGFYTHCVEVESVRQLESLVEGIIEEFSPTHTQKDIIDFWESMSVYASNMDNTTEEEAIYTFNFRSHIEKYWEN